jgi:hypothetical protein
MDETDVFVKQILHEMEGLSHTEKLEILSILREKFILVNGCEGHGEH